MNQKKYLHDIKRSADLATTFSAGKEYVNYEADAMLCAAMERQFEIIGEALSKLAKLDVELARQISEYRRIIAFRNILIHGYADVDNRLVWDIVKTKLPVLVRDVAELLAE